MTQWRARGVITIRIRMPVEKFSWFFDLGFSEEMKYFVNRERFDGNIYINIEEVLLKVAEEKGPFRISRCWSNRQPQHQVTTSYVRDCPKTISEYGCPAQLENNSAVVTAQGWWGV